MPNDEPAPPPTYEPDPPFNPVAPPTNHYDSVVYEPQSGIWWQHRWEYLPGERPILKTTRKTAAPEG